MSVQLVVCSPRHFLSNWTVVKSPESVFIDFRERLMDQGIEIPDSHDIMEYYSADLYAGAELDMIDVCYEESKTLADVMQGSVFFSIPGRTTLSFEYKSPGSNQDALCFDVRSVEGLLEALGVVEKSLRGGEPGQAGDKIAYCIDCYREAAKVTSQVGHPVFVSF